MKKQGLEDQIDICITCLLPSNLLSLKNHRGAQCINRLTYWISVLQR